MSLITEEDNPWSVLLCAVIVVAAVLLLIFG